MFLRPKGTIQGMNGGVGGVARDNSRYERRGGWSSQGQFKV